MTIETETTTGSPAAYTPPDPVTDVDLPVPADGWGYRLKRRLLGKPLHSEELEHQRLGKPTALAVFASDNLSSSAYATEEILHVLVPLVGIAAFSLVLPVTVAMCVVLGFLILSYRETIKAYPSAGGAYLVTRDNFGIVPAQVAGASLLTDYILTVAVSASAGTAALVSAFDGLVPYRVPIALFFIALIAYGNLRGVKESGRVFAVPTYFFMLTMLALLSIGVWKAVNGDLPAFGREVEGHVEWGSASDALFYGAGLFGVLHAFASGGAAVTGVEAISNGVPAFRRPEWKNARQTLVIMGTGLAVMFLGLSWLASEIKVAPFEEGAPTVISQIGEAVFGESTLGQVLYYSLQAGTMLILIMAANTGFADFPRLASFQAGDRFLPRQLTKRGHRLVYSNGIVLLAAVAMALVVATGAEVTNLIPLYAIGVFTGFTLSQSGMTRHHLRLREPGWRKGLLINGFGAFLSALVTIVIAVTKFADGAWAILITLPVMVVLLLRLNRQYVREEQILEEDVPAAATAPILRRHVVLVLVDSLDLASARAIQYARTLTPDEVRAVHFVIDDQRAEQLAGEWGRLGLARVPLQLVACPDRRLARAAVTTVARELRDGETEVTVLLTDRKYRGFWHRILHDRTADSILEEVSRLPHANVTSVPFHLDRLDDPGSRLVKSPLWPHRHERHEVTVRPEDGTDGESAPRDDGTTAIGGARWRQHVVVRGQVRSMRIAPQHDVPTLEIVLEDETGALSLVFWGRRELAGVAVGSRLEAVGTVGVHHNRLAIVNPTYRLLP
jgi:amino acid transporter